MGAYDHRPYEVGKGKPPKNTQWAPGTSGNPKGRKKKASSVELGLTEILAKLINEFVSISIDGKDVRIARKELILRGLIHDASAGKPQERRRAVEQLFRIGAFDLTPSDYGPTPEEQEAAIHEFVAKLAEEGRRSLDYEIDRSPLRHDPAWLADAREHLQQLQGI